MSQITLFLPAAASAQLDPQLLVWRVDTDEAELPFAEAVPREGAWRLVIPVEVVTVCAVHLPTTKARLLVKALPFAVEELLADDVELFHLSVGQTLVDGRHRVYAVRRDWLAHCLALCGANPPQRIEVDADLLNQTGTQLLGVNQRYLIGGSAEARLAVQADDWPRLMPFCPEPLSLYWAVEQAAPSAEGETEAAMPLERPWHWLAQQGAGCNLAHAEFAPRRPQAGRHYWRPLLALAGLWLVVQWGFNVAQTVHLHGQAQRYVQANEQLYRQLFPQDSRVVNVRAQFDQHLSALERSQQRQFLELLSVAAQALGQGDGQVEVRQLDFNRQRGDLALALQATDFSQLETLRQNIQEHGLQVDMGSASREQAGVGARLVIGDVR